MSLTQTMKIARNYLNNAEANLVDSMQVECPDPDFSLRIAIQECESAIENIELARGLRREYGLTAPGKRG